MLHLDKTKREALSQQPVIGWFHLLAWSYLLLISVAESLIVFGNAVVGMGVHTLILLGLTLYAGLGRDMTHSRLALVLTLLPLIRILSLTLPLAKLPQLAWYPMVLTPLIVVAVIVIRQSGLARAELGLRSGNPLLQLMLMGSGLGIGALQYWLLEPTQLVTAFSWNVFLLATLLVLLLTGVLEELIFRGILQAVALPLLGRWALFYVALLFATMYMGYRSVGTVTLALGVGLVFAYAVRWGGSIIGVALAHGLINVTALLIMPYLEQQTSPEIHALVRSVIAAGTTLALIAFIILLIRTLPAHTLVQPEATTGIYLRERRREAGMRYTDLALQTGISARLIAEIEYGLRQPHPEHLQRIVEVLSMAPDGLLQPTSAASKN